MGKKKLQKKLIGTWQMCKPDGTIDENINGVANNSKIKIITKESFSVIVLNSKNNNTIGNFWGTYELKKGKLSETIVHTSPNYSRLIEASFSFNVRVKNEFIYVTGLGNDMDELWKKIKE